MTVAAASRWMERSFTLTSGGACLMLGLAAPVFATGLSPYAPAEIPSDTRLSGADKGRVALAQFANCVSKARPAVVDAFLTRAEKWNIDALIVSSCLDTGTIKFPPILLRGALFAVKYRAVRHLTPPSLSPTSPTYANDFIGHPAEFVASYISQHEFADCVVRGNPSSAHAAVMAAPASAAEQEAFRVLAPQLSACIVTGANVQFSKVALSGLIAESLYRLATPVSDRAQTAGVRP